MKKYILVVMYCLLSAIGTQAQDIILKRSGEKIQAKVVEITEAEIKYRRFDNPQGPLYTLKKSEVVTITYPNGKSELITFPVSELILATDPNPLPKRTINFNPLGFLQFGPVIQGEFRVSERGYFTPHLRIPYLGILYHVINADAYVEDGSVSPIALGLGTGYKSLFPAPKGAWYVGGVMEYSFGSSTGDDGSAWESKFSNVAVLANGGFRWRWPGKKNVLSLGAYMGAFAALRDEWWYTTSPQDVKDERSVSPLFMLELSFGWEK